MTDETVGRRLSPAESELLRKIIWKRQPALAVLLDTLGRKRLSDEQRESLREALAEELGESGLREDDEPNETGMMLDGLIGRLGEF